MLIRPPEYLPRQSAPRRIAVRVKQKAVPAIRSGHPWLFEDSVKKAPPDAAPGDVAVLYDPDGKRILGAGVYDPHSQLRVRILQKDPAQPPVGPALFAKLATEAAERRSGAISDDTTAFRLANGESDGFPGLVADRYADTLVVKLYSEAFAPWAGDIADAFFAANPGLLHCVIRLSRALEDSPFVRRIFPEPAAVFTAKPEAFANPVRFQENGLVFEADAIRGQKTGFFLDQRDNRARVGTMSAGRDALNVFSFSGGFSLYAARGGAASVCSVDADKHAIAACERHFELNAAHPNVRSCTHEGIVGDAFEVMHGLARAKRRFGLVIVDPPSFAKSAAERERALHSYARLAALADTLLKPGGTLVFASCSSRVSADDFFPVILAHAHIREAARTGHAADHPALFPESHYLKCLYAEKLP
jgi:23S rRNA (cytosine1962-C5)-methyltransferase